jgi:thiol:disulfide interchange protein
MQSTLPAAVLGLLLLGLMLFAAGCSQSRPPSPEARGSADVAAAAPPPEIRAWMDRLTVRHAYDPKTGFIVARETVALPPLIADAPPLNVAMTRAGADRIVVAFATADRCAPCQQFKRDALNDASVIAKLSEPRFLPTHVEVDRSPELADAYLGGKSIPMTYALRDGKVIATLRGQRSAADLLSWLEALPG